MILWELRPQNVVSLSPTWTCETRKQAEQILKNHPLSYADYEIHKIVTVNDRTAKQLVCDILNGVGYVVSDTVVK
jgi:hypothetical protein